MKADFTESGEPAADYTGAHVVDAQGRLATIVSVYRCTAEFHLYRGMQVARLRHFNGEDAGEQALATLEILEREYEPEPDNG
jgi:hypothetical protein